MPMQVGPAQCEGHSNTTSPPDASSPDTTGNKQLDEISDNFIHDVVEAVCQEIPGIPDPWCDLAGEVADHFMDEVPAKVPPELQWNLESS